jgi:ActR/RegA family two-component response regulator
MGPGDILLLDDDDDLREAISDLVRIASGRSCVSLSSYAELAPNRERVLACVLAVLDANLGDGRPSGVDAYEWLRKEHFAGRIVFLTGYGASHPLVQRAGKIGGPLVLTKPIDADEVRSLINGPEKDRGQRA